MIFLVLCFVGIISTQGVDLHTQIGDNGWATKNFNVYYGLIKNCDNCYIAISIQEGYNIAQGWSDGRSYRTNTWSPSGFIKDTKTLVTIPDLDLEIPSIFIPWYNCGLAMIGVSSGTPFENLVAFEPAAVHWDCYDLGVVDDEIFSTNHSLINSGASGNTFSNLVIPPPLFILIWKIIF